MTENSPEATETVEGAQEPANEPENEPDTFPREYVETLRQEAAENRKKAKDVDTLREALRVAFLKEGSAGILREPIEWSDDFTDSETGLPDAEKIKAAAEALAADKPWLSLPRGDAGQGFRGDDSDTVSLADMLRVGA